MRESAVYARDLTLRYRSRVGRPPVTAIAGLTLDLAPGDTLAVIGDAGSGKSTLARALAGYTSRSVAGGVEIAGGALEVLGIDVRHLGRRGDSALGLRVGYVPQDAGLVLDPHLTVAENVALPLFLRDPRFSRKVAGGIAAEAIDAMHLTLATMPRFPHELSRGQRQRVAIARALVLEPELLIADEATAGIDATVRGMILAHLAEVQRQRRFAAFVVTSEIGEARRLADRLAVLHRGGIVGMGSVDEVLEYPQHPYVHRLAELARSRA